MKTKTINPSRRTLRRKLQRAHKASMKRKREQKETNHQTHKKPAASGGCSGVGATIPEIPLPASYISYHGYKGGYGQYGTAQIHLTSTAVCGRSMAMGVTVLMAVKSYLRGAERDLLRELMTLHKLQTAECKFAPHLYGKLTMSVVQTLQAGGANWGIGMERLASTLNDCYAGKAGKGELSLPKYGCLVEEDFRFFKHFLEQAELALAQFHTIDVHHHDVKPNNIGVRYKSGVQLPVKQFSDLEIVFFDWGMAKTGVESLSNWTDGTRPYSQKYWFQQSPGSVDHFQCLMVVLVYMTAKPHSYYMTKEFTEGAKQFGATWCSQVKLFGWLDFFLNHSPAVCQNGFHTNFCNSAYKFRGTLYNRSLRTLDSHFSRQARNNLQK